MLSEENALDQSRFESWIFCLGMLFNSPDKWWGDHGSRDYPHEGIDLCLYRDRSRRKGIVLATLADTSHSKANIIPHLDFSLGRPFRSLSYDRFVWNIIRDPKKINLLDPLTVIDWPYQALDVGESTRREL